MLVCCLPVTGYGHELPATDSETKSVLEFPAEPNAEPVSPSTVENPATAQEVTAPASPPTLAQSIEERSASPTPESSRQTAQSAIVKGFLFKGNTVIGKEQLESITDPYIGQALELPLLEKAAQAVTDFYRKKGYPLAIAYVPQQDIKFGVVELAVLEGRIGDITVSGNQHYSSSFIRGHFAQAMEDNVARNSSLERGLLLLNEYPGLKTSAILEAGKSAGATDVHVTAQDKRPLHVMLDMNNYGFNNISRSVLSAAGSGTNVTAGANSTLQAFNGVVGTQAAPMTVNINPGTLSIRATTAVAGISAFLTGTVLPSNALILLNVPLGLVCFNGCPVTGGTGGLAGLPGNAFGTLAYLNPDTIVPAYYPQPSRSVLISDITSVYILGTLLQPSPVSLSSGSPAVQSMGPKANTGASCKQGETVPNQQAAAASFDVRCAVQ